VNASGRWNREEKKKCDREKEREREREGSPIYAGYRFAMPVNL